MSDAMHSDEPRIEKALNHLKSMTIAGENIEAWTVQHRLFALTHRRAIVTATSGRFIGIERGLIGGYSPIDIRWQDLKEIKLKVGIFGTRISLVIYNTSDLSLAASGGHVISFGGLRKQQAQEIYRICQTHEQAWREKRRMREIEELRAKSGGIQISNGAAQASNEIASADSTTRLQQAKQMLESKLINDTEYEAIKAKIINSI